MQVEEFANEVSCVTSMRLIQGSGVFVIWDWRWESELGSSIWSAVTTVEESVCESDHRDGEEASSDSDVSNEEGRSHTLTFKCIGATRDEAHQIALRRARDRMEEGLVVSVKLQAEPDNIKDANTIAFMCLLDDSYVRMGSVVSKLLDEVHEAMNNNTVLDVKLSWIKYLTNWTFSGPGYFAGINITKKGTWSSKAIQSSSTR